MQLFTKDQYERLLQNGRPENRGKDHIPVAKLFLPGSACSWLLTEIDPEETSIAFGLCDLGMGFPELGSVSLAEITSVHNSFGLGVQRALHFDPKYPISVYALAAYYNESIVEIPVILEAFNIKKRDKLTP